MHAHRLVAVSLPGGSEGTTRWRSLVDLLWLQDLWALHRVVLVPGRQEMR